MATGDRCVVLKGCAGFYVNMPRFRCPNKKCPFTAESQHGVDVHYAKDCINFVDYLPGKRDATQTNKRSRDSASDGHGKHTVMVD